MRHAKRNPDRRYLSVTLSGKKFRLSLPRAFSLAHQLLCRGHLAASDQILEWLRGELPDDRRVNVLRARAAARRGDYSACNEHLNQAFLSVDEKGEIRGTLHTAMVYRAANLLGDSRKETADLCTRYPQFPSIWLFVGDLWHAVGRSDRAFEAWRHAIERDGADPKLVAAAARHRSAELAKSNRPTAATLRKSARFSR